MPPDEGPARPSAVTASRLKVSPATKYVPYNHANYVGSTGVSGWMQSRQPAPNVPYQAYSQERRRMHAPMKYVEKGLAVTANGLWQLFSAANKIKQNPSFTPRWSEKPLLKSYEKTK